MYDVVIIGGGPGGYAAALYAHNFGLSVALVEKDTVGGTCLLRGCVPAKAWLQTAHVHATVARAGEFGVVTEAPTLDWAKALERKNGIVTGVVRGLSGLLKSRGVEVIDGHGRLDADGNVAVATADGTRTLEANNVVLATGSVPATLPGWDIDGERIVTSDHALDWTERPERVAIIGGGVIGCEFATLLSEAGSQVTIFEYFDQILPGTDPDAVKILGRRYRKAGVTVHTGAGVDAPQIGESSVVVTAGGANAEVDVVLMAVGRRPLTDDVGLEHTDIEAERGFIPVDPASQLTSQPNVYAVGDIVAGTPQLAHAGYAEAINAITHIATGTGLPVDYRAIPAVVYGDPEIAHVGLTAAAAAEAGLDVDVTNHGVKGVARYQILGETDGMVKIVTEKGGAVVGATVVGPAAGDMIHELMYVVTWEALATEAAANVHAHPSLAEAIGETLLAAAGRPLH